MKYANKRRLLSNIPIFQNALPGLEPIPGLSTKYRVQEG